MTNGGRGMNGLDVLRVNLEQINLGQQFLLIEPWVPSLEQLPMQHSWEPLNGIIQGVT